MGADGQPSSVEELHERETRCVESDDHAPRAIDEAGRRIQIVQEHDLGVDGQFEVDAIGCILVEAGDCPLKGRVVELFGRGPHRLGRIGVLGPLEGPEIGVVDGVHLGVPGTEERRPNLEALPVEPSTGLEKSHGLGGEPPYPCLSQNPLKDGVGLSMHVRQDDRRRHKSGPEGRFKGKDSRPCLCHGRELIEIPRKEELEAAEGLGRAPHGLGHGVERLEQGPRRHADFVNDQEVVGDPVLLGPAVSPNAKQEVGHGLLAESDAGPRMERLAVV